MPRLPPYLSETLSPEQSFTPLDLGPYLARSLPDQTTLRAPSLNYLMWETSRTEQHRAELPELLQSSAAITDQEGLGSPDRVVPNLRPVLPAFLQALPEFPCTHQVGQITIHFRPEASPSR